MIFRKPNHIFIYIVLILSSCFAVESNEKEIKIGFSQCIEDDWRMSMLNEMERELLFFDDAELLYRNAQASNETQIEQIKELVSLGVNVLIVSPNEAKAITPIITEVYESGIPVILLDRKIDNQSYTTQIGANNIEIGRVAGQYIARLLGGKGFVLELYENPSVTAFAERSEGLNLAFKEFPSLKVDTTKAMILGIGQYKTLIKENHYDAIFAPTDVAAKFAYDLYDSLNLDGTVPYFIGIDGLAIPGGGMELVDQGVLTASLLYPTGGDLAIQKAMDIVRNEVVKKEYKLSTLIIDSSNVDAFKIQNTKLSEQQKDIEDLGNKITNLYGVFNDQRTLIYLFAFLFVISMLLLAYVIYALYDRRQINKELAFKNEQITDYARKAEEANREKVKFFTNISHEFKTPLTLVLSPIQELLNKKETSQFRSELNILNKNANRLLSLVNQIMDLRKLESGKMQLNASTSDLVQFTQEIIKAFKKATEDKSISLFFSSQEKSLPLCFDPLMMDKILFNLLSNSLKYTESNGRIDIKIENSLMEDHIKLIVEDTGAGMTEEELEHIFDRYFQGQNKRTLGTGIGMSLVKDLVDLHKGNIHVTTKAGKGTRVELKFLKGEKHFDEDQITNNAPPYIIQEDLFAVQTEIINLDENAKAELKDYSLLLIEDNVELRSYLAKHLSTTYEVIEAASVEKGIEYAFEEIPDLVICDLNLGNQSGFDVIRALKEDLKTSHIPIIILTAKSSLDEKIKGIKLGADDYITKPFNFSILFERINTLLVNREKLKHHYLTELPSENLLTNSSTKLDKKFVNEFLSVVEKNFADSGFGVNQICEEMGLSRVQLYRKVKAILGYSVGDYITNVRLKMATQLLHEGNLTISEIAHKVGYSTPAYFSTAFKQHFGKTPRAYQSE
jgi:signal transduction histidine kinase/AraC-like DNA-binding protein